jgi:hypothetical protein
MPTTSAETPVPNVSQPVAPPNVQQEVSAPVPVAAPTQQQTTNQPFGTVTVTFTPPPPPPPPPPPVQRPAAQGTVNVSVTPAAAPAGSSKTGLIVGVVVVAVVAIAAFMFFGKNNSTATSGAAPAANSGAPAANQPITAKDELNILLGLVRDGRWKEVAPKINQLKTLSQVNAGNRQEATTAYTTGAQLLSDGNLQGAAAEFEKAISVDASFGAPRFGLARSFARNGKLDTAASVLVDGLLIAPDSGDGWLAAAEVFAENGQEEAANASLKLALHLAQNRAGAMQFLNNANENVKSSKFKKLIENALPTLSGVPSK